MLIIWIYLSVLVLVQAVNNIERASYCYGDNSGGSSNLVDISCVTGNIYINDVIAATKPSYLNCPADDHDYSPAEQGMCCTYSETDCTKSFVGSWLNFLSCNGQKTCSGRPVIRDEPICPGDDFPRFSNYMVLEYYCMPVGFNYGPCNTSADCNDPAAHCNKSYCACQDGYTTFYAFDDCWKDGGLNGSCTGPVGCQDANTYCNFTSGRCQCDVGYIAYNGSCVQGGHNFGFCVDTADCSDPQAMCNKSVCVCEDGYTAFEEFDDCWKDGGLNGSCTVNNGCHDNYTTCDPTTNRCTCITGYAPTDGQCYADGDLHGYCQTNGDCAAADVECTDERCECVNGSRDIDGTCRQDGYLNGYCEEDSIECVDSNTECEDGICVCEDGYTDIDGICKEDGELGGKCLVNANCTDDNAECVSLQSSPSISICECIAGYTNIRGECIEDGTLFGDCTGSVVCKDNNTVCNATTSRCECATGYIPYNRVCYADGDLHGFCEQDSDCVDANVECTTDQRCECIDEYRDIDGICLKDGHLDGYCEVTVDCVDDNTECSEGICKCIDGYTNIDGICIKYGELGGACTSNSNCTDDNAVCMSMSNSALSTCKCSTNYTNIHGVCKEDRHLGGRCTSTSTCVDNFTNCTTEGLCVCIAGYSDVNSACKEDEKEGGVCGTNAGGQGQCTEDNTKCQVDTLQQCGGLNCVPGICKCKNNYNIGVDGTCTKDGDNGGVCNLDSDCKDSNANCIGTPLYCACSTGYKDADGVCVKDGDPGGNCLTGGICSDSHSVCVNGTCVCNDVRNYVLKGGKCQRNDSYINGECQNSEESGYEESREDEKVTCRDANAVCSGNKCVCKAGYSQMNGICTMGNVSSVTACNGSSPYNQLSPDCDIDHVPVIVETYERVKPNTSNCPTQVDIYSDAIFTHCCSYEVGDCRLDGTSDDACTLADLSGDYTTYTVIDYVCAKEDAVIDVATNDSVTNNQVYVTIATDDTGTSGQKTCSATASCETNIFAYLIFIDFDKVNGQCSQTLIITEGTYNTTFDCDYSVENTEAPIFTTSSGFFTFTITNTENEGRFVMEIQAEITTADVIVACGTEAETEGPATFGICGQEAGRLGGQCSSEIICIDPHTACQNGICHCESGYRQFETNCLEIVTEEDDTSNQNALLAVIIPVAILVTLAIAGVAFWLLKDRIRKKCFPDKELGLVKPMAGGPSPMNVKYPGRGAPSDVGIPKVMPPPWTNSGWSPMNEKFRRSLPNGSESKVAIPPRLPPISAAPMNTQYSGIPSTATPNNLADYLYKKGINTENNLHRKNQKKNSITPSEEDVISNGLVANGVAGSGNTQEINKKSKKSKKAKRSKLGKKAAKFNTAPQTEMGLMNGSPSFSQSLSQPDGPFVLPQGGHLPPLSESFHSVQPDMNGGVRAFDPQSSWRKAGTAASVAVQPRFRKISVLDIKSVDDPSNFEHTEIDV